MRASLSLENVSKRFGAVQALQNVTAQFERGVVNAVIGGNGCGKSTLLSVLSGALKVDEGTIFFEEREVTRLSQFRRARLGLFRAYQDPGALANMHLTEIEETAAHRLGSAAGTLFADKGETNGAKLTFGQRKRFILSLAETSDANYCLFDEPCAGVDAAAQAEIEQLLARLRTRERTVVFVEHDMEFVLRCAQHVFLMDRGKIVGSGTAPKMVDAYRSQQS